MANTGQDPAQVHLLSAKPGLYSMSGSCHAPSKDSKEAGRDIYTYEVKDAVLCFYKWPFPLLFILPSLPIFSSQNTENQ